jgi:hypothetical protein
MAGRLQPRPHSSNPRRTRASCTTIPRRSSRAERSQPPWHLLRTNLWLRRLSTQRHRGLSRHRRASRGSRTRSLAARRELHIVRCACVSWPGDIAASRTVQEMSQGRSGVRNEHLLGSPVHGDVTSCRIVSEHLQVVPWLTHAELNRVDRRACESFATLRHSSGCPCGWISPVKPGFPAMGVTPSITYVVMERTGNVSTSWW